MNGKTGTDKTAKSGKQALVPKLRFPEFHGSGDWDIKPLNKICLVNPSNSELPESFVYIDLESVSGGKLLNKKRISKDSAPSRAQRILHNEDVIFQIVRPYQRNNLFCNFVDNDDYVASTGYAQLRAFNSSSFLYQSVHTDDFVNSVIAKCTGSSYPAINSSDLAKLTLLIPEPEEQQKIADCLSSIDALIAAEAQKLDTIKAHKKGLMRQLFPAEGETTPKFRFPEFRRMGAWKSIPLNQLAKRCTQKNSQKKLTRVLTNSAEFGVVDQRDFFDKDIANQSNLEGYYIIEKGDYVYNPRISATAPVGPISKNNVATGVMSPLYTVFRFNNDHNDFYAHFFKTTGWHQYMRQASSTGARHDRMAITNDAFLDMPLPVTCMEEQQTICDCFSSLDELIAEETRKLALLKAHKQGLMQQLFPSLDEGK